MTYGPLMLFVRPGPTATTGQRCRFCDISGSALLLAVGVTTATAGQRCRSAGEMPGSGFGVRGSGVSRIWLAFRLGANAWTSPAIQAKSEPAARRVVRLSLARPGRALFLPGPAAPCSARPSRGAAGELSLRLPGRYRGRADGVGRVGRIGRAVAGDPAQHLGPEIGRCLELAEDADAGRRDAVNENVRRRQVD
jgi:hypothetical protein